MSYGMGTGYASIYFEPRDGVLCRFPASVRFRLLDSSSLVVNEVLRTTSGSPISGKADGAPIVVDVRHWAEVVVRTTNRDLEAPDEVCPPEKDISTSRVEVAFPGAGIVALDTDVIQGCGYLSPGPGVASIGAGAAMDDALDPVYAPAPPVDCSDWQITEKDDGATIHVGHLTSRFGICLDEDVHPLEDLNTDGCPFGYVSNYSLNGPDSYPIGFEVTAAGSCTVTNGNFRVTVVGDDPPR
jgi:hypothetical protein